jgi:3-methyladenine DNA glycosylase/8-oxoguanine DNA glycosylase
VDLIVAAMLAANSFSLLRAQEIVPKLRSARLLDPEHVCALEPGPLTVQLASAGYDRGMLTSMFAERLQALLRAVRDGKLDGLEAAITARNEADAIKLLTTIKGIGPVVARTAWALLLATGARE